MVERVAVTGVGMVSALGLDAPTTFAALVAGKRGFGPLSLFEPGDARAAIAAEVHGLDVPSVAPPGQAESWSRTDAMAVLAAREALAQAGGLPGTLGVCLGGTTGGMLETEQGLLAGPLDRIDPARAARLLSHPLDLTTARVAHAVGGAMRLATLCAACSSGALTLVEGAAWLLDGGVERVLAGGADGLCRLTYFGFDALGALDREPCRPFDAKRRGLGLGEGAAFLCLEREAAARARGATILAFLSGAATGAEAHHITHPEPSGERAAELVTRALDAAGLSAAELDYVNAHGTGTEQNDAMEARALLRALGAEVGRVFVSSSKGQLGHTLGAAGALEAAVTVLALVEQTAPPTAGLAEPAEPRLRHVLERGVSAPLRAAASCSFGFGGTGAVLLFERADATSRAATRSRAAGAAGCELVVTGVAAVGPFGLVAGEAVARSVLDAPEAAGGALARDPTTALDPERSRRFDRAAGIVSSLTECALQNAGGGSARTGLAVATAFGAVERSVRFVLRAAERGVRRANPAEFPHLVASAASGNASIYAGLTGAAFGVSAGGAGAEVALQAGAAYLALEQAGAFVVGASEGFDPIVAEVLGPARSADGAVPRSEGGGSLVLEPSAAARARGASPVARWLGTFSVSPGDPWPSAPGCVQERTLVVTTLLTGEQEAAFLQSAWGGCPRRSVAAACGHHEAVSGIALAVAAAAIRALDRDETLVVNGTPSALWLTHFARAEGLP
jgi:3-oxoacyl-[acyl-carrier-protein] synthase II